MSAFTDKLSHFLDGEDYDAIRISVCEAGGTPDTLERQRLACCQNTYSVAKTFTMAAIGILYDKGLVKPEDRVCEILKDEMPENIPDRRWYDVTVHHALTHSAGLPGGFLDIDVHKSSEFTDDYLKFMFMTELEYNPGENSRYSDGAFYLLSCIAEKLAGECMDNFLWKELFLKLDFQEAAWSHCPKGHAIGATGLYINSYDMVKLGVVFLDGGLYNGERILSEEWVRLAVDRGYGLGWDEGKVSYSKGGMNGQTLMMVPSKKLAIAVQSFGGDCGKITNWIIENY